MAALQRLLPLAFGPAVRGIRSNDAIRKSRSASSERLVVKGLQTFGAKAPLLMGCFPVSRTVGLDLDDLGYDVADRPEAAVCPTWSRVCSDVAPKPGGAPQATAVRPNLPPAVEASPNHGRDYLAPHRSQSTTVKTLYPRIKQLLLVLG
jgi:hypothetical protein